MNTIITFTAAESVPDRTRVLAVQGVPADPPPPERLAEICDDAIAILLGTAEPRGLVASLSREDFASVFAGAGLNAPDSPVGSIYGRADHLALYAATIGETVSDAIADRFEADDYATAVMLDSAASLMTDSLSDRLARILLDELASGPEQRVLPYSPGYCGWHVSGQRRLFDRLHPERIGVTLNESCLMEPIKSVSGVLIAAPAEVHRFRPGYEFCKDCRTKSCRERIEGLSAG